MPDRSQPAGADRAGADYWDVFWRRRRTTGVATRASYFHRRVIALLSGHAARGTSVLEVGCGGSVWLPALAARGARCWGIDRSAEGLALLEHTLTRRRVEATLVAGDLFDPAALPARYFDVVYSVGLVEHFSPPGTLLQRLGELVSPDGVLVTLVPNFTGRWGRWQRRLDPEVYDTHVIYTPSGLDGVHCDAGLAVAEPARFFGGFAPLVVNPGRALAGLPPAAGLALTATVWVAQQAVAWASSGLAAADGPGRSGYIAGVYRAGRRAT